MALQVVQPLPHKLNSPSTNKISTDNAEQSALLENSENELRQLDLLQKSEKERVHQLHPLAHELNSASANEISPDNVEQLDLLQKPERERLHQLPPHGLNPPTAGEISTDNAEQLVLLEKPEKEQLHQIPPHRHEKYFMSAKIALALIFTIFYHTFCFIVHYRAVPIGRSGILGLTFLHCEQYHSYGHFIVADCLVFSSSQHRGCHHNCGNFDCLCCAVAYEGRHRRDQGMSDYLLSVDTALNSRSFLVG